MPCLSELQHACHYTTIITFIVFNESTSDLQMGRVLSRRPASNASHSPRNWYPSLVLGVSLFQEILVLGNQQCGDAAQRRLVRPNVHKEPQEGRPIRPRDISEMGGGSFERICEPAKDKRG
ncbi:hypothetical protein HK102_001007 [Quaeritorhiza haematococci]|nr:hypothetical protein HK102_001007 [Quaeritorhiza haematococci]